MWHFFLDLYTKAVSMVAYPPWQKGTVEERPGGWLYTTRLAAYAEGGGGFVGVRAAACTEYDWPYYGEHGLDRRLAAERGPVT